LDVRAFENEDNTTLDVSDIDTSNLTSLDSVFMDLTHIERIVGLETWDVSNVEAFGYMFRDCKRLREINVSGWDVSKGSDFERMFEGCLELENIIGIEDWEFNKNPDSNNTYTFNGMFAYCENLKHLPIDFWNVDNFTIFNSMFNKCKSLISLDLSKWNVSKMQDAADMFKVCRSLKSVGDISKWDIGQLRSCQGMFKYCDKLTLDISNWKLDDKCLTHGMFYYTDESKLIHFIETNGDT
jgi:surface protein